MQEKVEGWEESVRTLAGVDRKHPQSAYAGLQKPLQQEWAFVQRVTPGISNAFGPVEEEIAKAFLRLPLPYEAPEVSAPRDHLYPHPAKVFLGPGYILLRDHQDALGGLGKVSPGRPLQLEVPEVSHDIAKCPSRPRVIRIPRLVDLGMVGP